MDENWNASNEVMNPTIDLRKVSKDFPSGDVRVKNNGFDVK